MLPHTKRLSAQLFYLFVVIVAINYYFKTIICLTDSEFKTTEKFINMKKYSCDFEIFGRVQGVFFRKYTQKEAQSLKLRGWCMNTHTGTVKGQIQGNTHELSEMKHWLQEKGSPKSRISKAIFGDFTEIPEYTFDSFTIRK